MNEIARHWHVYLIGIGAIAAWCGLTFYGMGLSYREPRSFDVNVGLGLMIGGLIVLAIGIFFYMRRPESER
ncbi:MAG TPA: hypothetical protein VGT61_01155 [Thermomicrobiales bacterium]|jgi:hypothetical protein|nr:hypothetical protein [Thermomicrobiales bacterium]